jgi:hypothetical protein
MGKTPIPLKIMVHPDLWDTPEVQALASKGHFLHRWMVDDGSSTAWDMEGMDLIVGPNCWRIVPALVKYLDLAVKSARKGKKGK